MGPGSHVVITTRNSGLLSKPLVHACYQLGRLSSDQSLELFSWHAFSRASPPAGVDSELVKAVVDACGGLPLTLEVIGCFLYGPYNKQRWTGALESLQLGEAPEGSAEDQLFARLRLSYDDLAPRLQSMFLDAACFFVGKPVGAALAAWGACAYNWLDILSCRCLLQTQDSDDEGQILKMHDQLQELGRHIAAQENSAPHQRSRVWMPESQRIITGRQVWAFARMCLSRHVYVCFLGRVCYMIDKGSTA